MASAGDYLHEISNPIFLNKFRKIAPVRRLLKLFPQEKFFMKCYYILLSKNQKKISTNSSSAEIAQRGLKMKKKQKKKKQHAPI